MSKNPHKGRDRFTEAAQRAGFPARSVFKLEEIDRRVRILRPGLKVLDLGSSPGSWSLYAAGKVGLKGHVLSIDLDPLTQTLPVNALFVQADAFNIEAAMYTEHGPFNVVLSDMAPKTTGNRLGDQTKSFDLFMHALDVAEAHLLPGGTFVGKIFMGEDMPIARARVKKIFESERLIRPESTRSASYEVFCIGEKKRAS